MLGGGGVPGASILVQGPKGVGKSTSALVAAMNVARSMGGIVLYACAEMREEDVLMLYHRAKLDPAELERLEVIADSSLDVYDVVSEIDDKSPAAIVWDSIQRIRSEGHVGERELVHVVNLAIERGRAHEAVSFLLSHVTKKKQIVGPSSIEHDVDVVLELRKTRGGRVSVACPEKNRFAPTPARSLEGPRRARRLRSIEPLRSV